MLTFEQFPKFDAFDPKLVLPTIENLDQQCRDTLSHLETSASPTWDDLVIPLITLNDNIERQWSIVSHLVGVKNSDELREAHKQAQPIIVRLSTSIEQSEPIYHKLVSLQSSPDFDSFSSSQKRVIESYLRDARLAGVHLKGESKDRFNTIEEELAELATKFNDNVLDSTKAYFRSLSPADLEGLPESLVQLMAQNAKEKGVEGHVVTLDHPVYGPFMKHCKKRELRMEVYKQMIQTASDEKFNNSQNVENILALRKEKAQLIGYDTHAHVSLQSKAISQDPEDVFKFLENIRSVSFKGAEREFETLSSFVETNYESLPDGVKQWDFGFYLERYKETHLSLKEEALRPYFELNSVLEGLFAIVHDCFGVLISEVSDEKRNDLGISVWNDDCIVFEAG
ncbi:hypothetical protein GEMRC1_011658 [Eukaryota sp. GEM-RC1]